MKKWYGIKRATLRGVTWEKVQKMSIFRSEPSKSADSINTLDRQIRAKKWKKMFITRFELVNPGLQEQRSTTEPQGSYNIKWEFFFISKDVWKNLWISRFNACIIEKKNSKRKSGFSKNLLVHFELE